MDFKLEKFELPDAEKIRFGRVVSELRQQFLEKAEEVQRRDVDP